MQQDPQKLQTLCFNSQHPSIQNKPIYYYAEKIKFDSTLVLTLEQLFFIFIENLEKTQVNLDKKSENKQQIILPFPFFTNQLYVNIFSFLIVILDSYKTIIEKKLTSPIEDFFNLLINDKQDLWLEFSD